MKFLFCNTCTLFIQLPVVTASRLLWEALLSTRMLGDIWAKWERDQKHLSPHYFSYLYVDSLTSSQTHFLYCHVSNEFVPERSQFFMNMSLATSFPHSVGLFSPNGLVYTLALNCLPTSGCNLISNHTAKKKKKKHQNFWLNFNTTDRTQELSLIFTPVDGSRDLHNGKPKLTLPD